MKYFGSIILTRSVLRLIFLHVGFFSLISHTFIKYHIYLNDYWIVCLHRANKINIFCSVQAYNPIIIQIHVIFDIHLSVGIVLSSQSGVNVLIPTKRKSFDQMFQQCDNHPIKAHVKIPNDIHSRQKQLLKPLSYYYFASMLFDGTTFVYSKN